MAYLTATKLNKEEAEVQVSTLLTIIGAEGHRVFFTFHWEREAGQKSLEKVIQKFGEYVQPKVNIAVERFKFSSRNQGVGEPFDQYVTVCDKWWQGVSMTKSHQMSYCGIELFSE